MGLTIHIDGLPAHEVNRRIQRLTITDNSEATTDTATLTLANPRNEISLPRFGAKMSFSWDGTPLVGLFSVNEVSGNQRAGTMTIIGGEYDATTDLRSARTASYGGQTLGQIAKLIVDRYNLPLSISDEFASFQPSGVSQNAQSDLTFLTLLAAEANARLQTKGGRIVFLPRAGGKSASGKELDPFNFSTADPDTWFSFTVSARKITKVTARYLAEDDITTLMTLTLGKDGGATETHPQIFQDRAKAEQGIKAALADLEPEHQKVKIETKLRPNLTATQPVVIEGLNGLETSFKIVKITHFFSSTEASKSILDCTYFPGD